MSTEEEIPSREVAYRVLAAEYDDASLSHTESDEERAPNYVISPTGARLNRLFVSGTLTEVSPVNEEMLRARVVDPTGAFVVYAGQYQPDELAALERLAPPEFVAITGKARTFEPDDGDRVFTSVRPESIATVDGDTRDRWVVSAVEQTLERVRTYAAAAAVDADPTQLQPVLEDAGVEPGLAAGIPLAIEHYQTTPSYLAAVREHVLATAAVVAGDRDQVPDLDVDPETHSSEFETTFEALADAELLAGIRATLPSDDESADPVPSEPTGSEPTESDTRVGTATAQTASEVAASADGSEAATTAPDESAADEAVSQSAAAEEPQATDAGSTALADANDDDGASEPIEKSDGSADTGSGDLDTEDASEPDGAVTDSSSDETESTPSETSSDQPEPTPGDSSSDESIAEGGMYEMDDEERAELEAEFGAEFSTGAEVDGPSEDDEPASTPAGDATESGESGADESVADDSESEVDDDLGAPPTSTLEDQLSGPDAAAESPAEDEVDSVEAAPAGTSGSDDPAPAADNQTGEPPVDDQTEEQETDAVSDDDGTEGSTDEVDLQTLVVETMQSLDEGDGADRATVVDAVAEEAGVDAAAVEDAIQDALMGGQCYEPDDDTLKAI